ncbi:hypothetical protein AB7M33_004747 [Pseudomonas sp. Y3 TE3536]
MRDLGRSSLVLRRGRQLHSESSLLAPASSQHKAAPTGAQGLPVLVPWRPAPSEPLPSIPGKSRPSFWVAGGLSGSLPPIRGSVSRGIGFSIGLSVLSTRCRRLTSGSGELRPCAIWVGAALCCEEVGNYTVNLRCLHRPLRSTRLLLRGLKGCPCSCLGAQHLPSHCHPSLANPAHHSGWPAGSRGRCPRSAGRCRVASAFQSG